jgi:hypothetical protein
MMSNTGKVALAGLAAAVALAAFWASRKAQATPTPTPTPTPTRCTSVTQIVTSKTFTSEPVSAIAFGPYQYFIETDTWENICNDTGEVIESGTFDTAVSPYMVARFPSDYPQYIVDTYRQMYPEYFTGT